MSSEKNIRNIVIVRARVNNLKNLSVTIPHNKLVVITGLSGSGKSSLAFDTLYAEGQRRYVESLSSYARQFLGRMNKPDVDQITGISPAIAIEQKVNSRNPRSTVGTSTEIYEYIKLLFSRIGKTISPVSGKVVKRHQVSDVVDFTINLKSGTQVLILSPFQVNHNRQILDHLTVLLQQGFNRVLADGDLMKIEDILKDNAGFQAKKLFIVVDRIRVNPDDKDLPARIADSVQTAFYEGHGSCVIQHDIDGQTLSEIFSNKFEADGIVFEEPSVNMFTFNNPFGACRTCEGFGSIIGIDPDLVIPNKALSVYEGAVACWKGEKMGEWKDKLVTQAEKFGFPVHKPYYQLNTEQKELLWTGNDYFDGLNDFFRQVEEQTYKIQYRVMLSRYRGKTICPDCLGTRLRKDANYVKIDGFSISELVMMPVDKLLEHFSQLKLNKHDLQVADRLIKEITTRLSFLVDVGLGYLTLNRLSNTLSGGESQRINLATSLGSSLVGSTYILDEPSIGLHSRDTQRLIKILRRLRDIGNTVLIVEHDEEIIKAADQVIDIGPLAGSQGGELVFQGTYDEIIQSEKSLTGAYLSGRMKIELPALRRRWVDYIEITGACENNLKNIDIDVPLGVLASLSGVSGSGKSTFLYEILYKGLKGKFDREYRDRAGKFDSISGYESLRNVVLVDQSPIGRTPRSNPATYTGVFTPIREFFAQLPESKLRGYQPGRFSFNVKGGRCESCKGDGELKVSMLFLQDVYVKCDVCKGTRYNRETLEVKHKGLSIADVLELTVDEAVEHFKDIPRIVNKLKVIQEAGLGYIKLGQPAPTLSGGEAQRVKLATELSKKFRGSTLYLLDEPTTGLHYNDVKKLLKLLHKLVDHGSSVLVIEHNLDVLASADYIMDLGPEGGRRGGDLIAKGTPEEIAASDGPTGKYLAEFFNDIKEGRKAG